jgi:hypothetical protein
MPATLVRSQYVWSPVYVDALVLRDRDPNGTGGLDGPDYLAFTAFPQRAAVLYALPRSWP